MSVADKLATMESLWDDLCRHADQVPVPEWHREILAVREAEFAAGEDNFLDWAAAKDQLRKSCK
jgi:hypothetical protein